MSRKRFIIMCMLLLGGLYAAGLGLWRLGNAAIFMHESVILPGVVVDVRERPFEDVLESLAHGNLPWQGAVAHQPHVRYEFAGLSRVDTTLPDLDNQDYDRGQTVEIRLHPQKPHLRHLNKFKFIWGEHLLLLGAGLLLLLVWRLNRRRRRRAAAAPGRRRRPATVAVPLPASIPAAVAEPVAELVQDIVDPPAAPKKRRRAPAKPKDPNAPAKPRRSSKSSAAAAKDPAAPKKRRRKTKDSSQG